jgi:decaprenylphospho-beta-D-erythro-pentofuranosid-2-ulose 2-reductase
VRNAVGALDRVVVLGGSSAIALATVRRWLGRRPGLHVTFGARPSPTRDAAEAELTAHGAKVRVVDLDVTGPRARSALEDCLAGDADIDAVLLAFGVLGDQEAAWQDPDAALRLFDVNARAAVESGVLATRRLRSQGHGSLILLSSVAAERPRRSNFAYGASKAGADAFYVGLGEAAAADGVHVLVVRPGFVRSPMTAGLPSAPLAVAPEAVAAAIEEGIDRGRRVVWVPAGMRLVMSGLRHLPAPIFRRLPL